MLRHIRRLGMIVFFSLVAFAAQTQRTRMLVDTQWLASHISDPNVVVIHVGSDRKSYDAGHIPNARFLALSSIAVTRNGIPNELPSSEQLKSAFEALGVDNKKRVVLYGDHNGLLASRAYFTLDYLGASKNAALLDGGLEKWKSESRSISKDVPSVTPAKLKISLHPELVATEAQVEKAIASKSAPMIDARPNAEYAGAKAGEGVPRPGHIPGAANVFWVNNLQSEHNPVMKSDSEIRSNYEKAGVKPGDKPIVYCRTGVQASHDYFTLKMLGYKPVLYDGSFFEWSNGKGTQVETGSSEKTDKR